MTRAHATFALLAALAFSTPVVAQEDPVLHGDEYQALDASSKRARLWSAISAEPYEGDLPTKGAIGGALKATLGRFTLRATFDDRADIRKERGKTFHRWGTTVLVRYEPVTAGIAGSLGGAQPRHPYTGIFAEGALGLARLSLGLGDTKLWAPGIGLKLFVDGEPSLNVHAIPRDGGQESKDFLAPALSTQIDPTPLDGFLKLATGANPTLRKVDHLAATCADGGEVAEPRAPHHLEFRAPASIAFSGEPAWGDEDFRTSLAKISAGTVLYEVWAFASEDDDAPTKIGLLRTDSAFVASAFQDRRLHFHHVR